MDSILIIDDDFSIRWSLRQLLSSNYAVFESTSKNDTLEILRNNHIDLCLLDVNLIGCNGFELCQEIRGKYLMPIIFVTVNDDEESLCRGLTCGGDDYITKPFSFVELELRIMAQLRRSEYQKSQTKRQIVRGLFVMDFLVAGTVLVSEKLFCELMGMNASRYNDVFAIGNDRLSYEVGDKLMSGISPYVNFTNNRVERETERKILLTDIASFGSLAILVCALGIALLIRNRRSLMEAESSRLRLLRNLGCSSKTVEKSYIADMGYWFIPLAALLNIYILLTYAYWQYAYHVPKAPFFPFWRALFRIAYLEFPWVLLMLPQLLLLCTLVLIFKKPILKAVK